VAPDAAPPAPGGASVRELQLAAGNHATALLLGRFAASRIQRMPSADTKLGRYYRVEGYNRPLELVSRFRPGQPDFWLGFRLPGVASTVRVADENDVVEEVAFASEQARAEATAPMTAGPQRDAITAALDAERRVREALKVLHGKPTERSTRQEARQSRESKAFLVGFEKGLTDMLAFIRARFLGTTPAGLTLEPENPGTMGERARTDRSARKVILYKSFFETGDRTSRAATLIHESVHAALDVEDRSYKTARAFAFLTDDARLANPDSFVALIEELEGVEKPDRAEPITAERVVPADVRAEAAFRVAIAQHILQRASYLFDGVKTGITPHIPAFLSQGKEVKWFLSYVREKLKLDEGKAASTAARLAGGCRNAANALAAPITVVAISQACPADAWEPSRGELRLTYCRTPPSVSQDAVDSVLVWLMAEALKLCGYEDHRQIARAAFRAVRDLEPVAGFAQ
jgi:hypothetical protein